MDLSRIVYIYQGEQEVGRRDVDLDIVVKRILDRDFKYPTTESTVPVNNSLANVCWRVVVVPGCTVNGASGFWVVWAYHHVIGDGISGQILHRDLLRILNSGDPEVTIEDGAPSPIVFLKKPDGTELNRTVTFPPSLESVFTPSLGFWYIFKAFCNEYLPFTRDVSLKLWSCGAQPAKQERFIAPTGLRTELHTLRISNKVMLGVLNEARKHNTTFTALLEALISLAILEVFPAHDAVRVIVVISARRWLGDKLAAYGGAENVLGIYVTQILQDFTRDALSSGPGEQPLAGLWAMAEWARERIKQVIHSRGKNTNAALLQYVGSLDYHFKSKIGTHRQEGLEVSNIGVFKGEASGATSAEWDITEMRFAQSASAVGVALTCNVASVHGGAMCLGFTWQEGVASWEEIEKVCGRTNELLEMVGTAGLSN